MPDSSQQDLAQRIEAAFQDGHYPGDDYLVYDNSQTYLDVVETKQDFLGKHWKDLSIDVINRNRNNSRFFTPQAFYFYLPAFLIASVLYPIDVVDVLPENLMLTLMPSAEIPELNDWLTAVLQMLTIEQKRVIMEFVTWDDNTYTGEELKHLDLISTRAVRFWTQIIQSLS